MKSLITLTSICLLLAGLVSFRPWQQLNHAIGLDSGAIARIDTLLVEPQPVAAVMPNADSMAREVAQSEKKLTHFKGRQADLNVELPKIRKKVEKQTKQYNDLATQYDRNIAKRDSLVGERKEGRISKAATSTTPAGASSRSRGQGLSIQEQRYVSRGWRREDSAQKN